MPKTRIVIIVDSKLLKRVDELVAQHGFRNRTQAIEAALTEKIDRPARSRLAEACSKLDPVEEKRFAEGWL